MTRSSLPASPSRGVYTWVSAPGMSTQPVSGTSDALVAACSERAHCHWDASQSAQCSCTWPADLQVKAGPWCSPSAQGAGLWLQTALCACAARWQMYGCKQSRQRVHACSPAGKCMSGVGDVKGAYLYTAADGNADICLAPGLQLQACCCLARCADWPCHYNLPYSLSAGDSHAECLG